MITVICGTNRPNSRTHHIARHYHQLLTDHRPNTQYLSLENLPPSTLSPAAYKADTHPPALSQLQDTYLIPAQKFLFVIPEYNGSIPGALKLLIDTCSVRQYKPTFTGKKAAIVGVASGRAGNLRGIEHLTGILHHLSIHVLPQHLPISQVNQLINEQGTITHQKTLESIQQQAEAFLAF